MTSYVPPKIWGTQLTAAQLTPRSSMDKKWSRQAPPVKAEGACVSPGLSVVQAWQGAGLGAVWP